MYIKCSMSSEDFYLNDLADWIVKLDIATKEEVALVTHLMGWSESTLTAIIHERTGYDDIYTYLNEVYPDGRIET